MVNTTLFWMQTSLRKKALQVNRKALGVNKKVPLTLHTYFIRRFQGWIKLSKDLFQWFTADISKDIKSSPVWHSHDDTLHTKLTWLVNDCLHCWNQYFTAFNAEALFWWPFLGEKSLKPNNAWLEEITKGKLGNEIQPPCKPTQQQQHIYKNKQYRLYSIFHPVTMFT